MPIHSHLNSFLGTDFSPKRTILKSISFPLPSNLKIYISSLLLLLLLLLKQSNHTIFFYFFYWSLGNRKDLRFEEIQFNIAWEYV